MDEHKARVEVVTGRYPFRPVCECGWSYRGYLTDYAAQGIADAHENGEI